MTASALVRPDVVDLARGESLDLVNAAGARLSVACGMLWLTMERDRRDVVLGDGESFTVDRPGLTIVQAQSPTRLWLLPHGRIVRRTTDRSMRLVDRWVGALLRLGESTRRGFVPYY